MSRTKFKDFMANSPNLTLSDDVNKWIEDHPHIRIIRWSASPCGNSGTRLILEYEDAISKKAAQGKSYADYWEDY